MKRFFTILSVTLLSFSLNSAIAQTTAQANLKITLNAVQSLVITSPNVDFTYTTAADYAAVKTSGAIANHLKVTSTGLYTVSVKTSGDFTSGVQADDIPISALTLTPALISSATTLNTPTENTLAGTLTTSDQPFLKSLNGTSDAKYSVEYSLDPGTASANLINRPAGNYTATITYTITAN